jgi:hypothetical protein
MRIEHYGFGEIVIDGKTYREDLLIWNGRIKRNWWRLEAHLLQLPDVAEALAAEPRVLVVGQGMPGRMVVAPELGDYLKERGIELICRPTREAVAAINQAEGRRPWAAALHLTC